MIRRRSTPWIHKWSRLIIAAIAGFGALVTGYLTITKLTKQSVACGIEAIASGAAGCNDVLNSPWGTVFGQPLALFGFLAYIGMFIFALAPLAVKSADNKKKHQQIEGLTWSLLLLGSVSMTVFSSYLMFVLATQIKALCPYCIASALFSLSMMVLTIVGRTWEDIGQLIFQGFIVGMVTLVGTLVVYSSVNQPAISSKDTPPTSVQPVGNPKPPKGWEVSTTSGESEIQLAKHLKEIGAKKYAAWSCPHCYEQKQLFGEEAAKELDIIECQPRGVDPKPEQCQAAKIPGFPTWIIKGQQYSGVQSLNKLADLSDYKGSREFKNFPDQFQ
ncbi:MAG: vitamin K epoxide reductase family protein [Cyanobacteria bacterium P01_A01_bin.84]